MHIEIERYTRGLISEKLSEISDEQFMIFKRMYAHLNLTADRETVALNMDINKTDHALVQLDNQINKNKNNGTQFKH